MKKVIKATLSEQIYEILREDIISQNIRCGQKLTLKALQERFEISSTPIREAMNRLSQEGLLEHITNVGAKVVEIGEKDIAEIYDFCSSLDATALKLALRSGNADEMISELNRCIASQENSLQSGDMEAFKIHSDNFHDIFYKYANNVRLYNAALNIRSQLTILTNRYQSLIVARSVVFIDHKEIADAIAKRDIEEAITLMTNHFEHAKNYLLNNIKSSEDKGNPEV